MIDSYQLSRQDGQKALLRFRAQVDSAYCPFNREDTVKNMALFAFAIYTTEKYGHVNAHKNHPRLFSSFSSSHRRLAHLDFDLRRCRDAIKPPLFGLPLVPMLPIHALNQRRILRRRLLAHNLAQPGRPNETTRGHQREVRPANGGVRGHIRIDRLDHGLEDVVREVRGGGPRLGDQLDERGGLSALVAHNKNPLDFWMGADGGLHGARVDVGGRGQGKRVVRPAREAKHVRRLGRVRVRHPEVADAVLGVRFLVAQRGWGQPLAEMPARIGAGVVVHGEDDFEQGHAGARGRVEEFGGRGPEDDACVLGVEVDVGVVLRVGD